MIESGSDADPLGTRSNSGKRGRPIRSADDANTQAMAEQGFQQPVMTKKSLDYKEVRISRYPGDENVDSIHRVIDVGIPSSTVDSAISGERGNRSDSPRLTK